MKLNESLKGRKKKAPSWAGFEPTNLVIDSELFERCIISLSVLIYIALISLIRALQYIFVKPSKVNCGLSRLSLEAMGSGRPHTQSA